MKRSSASASCLFLLHLLLLFLLLLCLPDVPEAQQGERVADAAHPQVEVRAERARRRPRGRAREPGQQQRGHVATLVGRAVCSETRECIAGGVHIPGGSDGPAISLFGE